MEDVAVEVCGENGAYYKAYITDVHEDEVTVAFENEQPESKFPYNRVRLPPAAPKDDKPVNMIEGQEVEVFSRANEQEACGWWHGLVKMTKGNFHVIEYLGWETTYSEIVPSDRLRLKNTNQPITKSTFYQFEIPLPEDVQEYSKLESAHKEFKKAIVAVVCKYNADKKSLQIIFFSSQNRQMGLKKRALMLSDMHFRNLRQKLKLLNRTDEAARQLQAHPLPPTLNTTIGTFAAASSATIRTPAAASSATYQNAINLAIIRAMTIGTRSENLTTPTTSSTSAISSFSGSSSFLGNNKHSNDDFDTVFNQTTLNNCTVYCKGLNLNTTNESLKKIFSLFGIVEDVDLYFDRSDYDALIRFNTKEAATLAICSINNTEIDGRRVKCTWSKDPNFWNHQAQVASVGLAPSTISTQVSSQATCIAFAPPPTAAVITKKGTEEKTSDIFCKICMDEELGVVFLPCGHLTACEKCAQQISTCPLCRKLITSKIRTYLG